MIRLNDKNIFNFSKDLLFLNKLRLKISIKNKVLFWRKDISKLINQKKIRRILYVFLKSL
jgi:hypothetical protein